jgi:nitrate/TMAO reductase-like tetraheme cytochrome c subunit
LVVKDAENAEISQYPETTIQRAGRIGFSPRDWFYKVQRKIAATNELFHKVMGTIDTPEKFEKHRLALATTVWDTMKATDSRECRNCHSAASMNPAKQSAAAKVMMSGLKAGLTCIDCHKGIAHKLPV